jgi:hypothetical protein
MKVRWRRLALALLIPVLAAVLGGWLTAVGVPSALAFAVTFCLFLLMVARLPFIERRPQRGAERK